MVSEAIILAGGFGLRLQSEVPDVPKSMAPVASRPFLFYVINYLRSQGINRFIFSLGYLHEMIENWLAEQYPTLEYECVVEKEPLGTGGAIHLCCERVLGEQVLVTNGDTLFKVNLHSFYKAHDNAKAECTIALKPMEDFDRYGAVEINETGKITQFKEKQFYSTGFINGGVYLLNKNEFLARGYPPVFSFEKFYLEPLHTSIYGHPEDVYFIDIGIPEDFRRANEEFAMPPLRLEQVDHNWTLFIDRDGVINPEKKDDYIRNVNEFRFYDGVVDALNILSKRFGKIIIVSNQRGVGRRLMSQADLDKINSYMKQNLESGGGRVDDIYFCTATDNKDPRRKPNPGMAFQARADHPEIDFSRSVMVGNKPSDMLFGKYVGMYTVFVATTNPDHPFPHPDIDLRFNSLPDFAKAL